MANDKIILAQIKKAVHEVVPDAKVILFGSRVTGNVHDESDWDVLVLTKERFGKNVKWEVHDRLYPVALAYNTFIHITFTSEDEWENGATYYALKTSIANEMIDL